MKCKNRAGSRDLTKPHRDRQKAVPVPTDATLRLLSLEPCKNSQPLHSLPLSLHFHQTSLSLSPLSRLFNPAMLSQSHFLSLSSNTSRSLLTRQFPFPPSTLTLPIPSRTKFTPTTIMISNSKLADHTEPIHHSDIDRFAGVGNELADAAGEVIRKYFRKSFDILDKDDLSKFFLEKLESLLVFECLFDVSVVNSLIRSCDDCWSGGWGSDGVDYRREFPFSRNVNEIFRCFWMLYCDIFISFWIFDHLHIGARTYLGAISPGDSRTHVSNFIFISIIVVFFSRTLNLYYFTCPTSLWTIKHPTPAQRRVFWDK